MTTLKQIRCKNCESFNNDCEEDYEETNCEVTLNDVREWIQQKQPNENCGFVCTTKLELLEELTKEAETDE